jgi:hypothetical protein
MRKAKIPAPQPVRAMPVVESHAVAAQDYPGALWQQSW